MKKFKVLVGHANYVMYEAELEIEADDINEAWEKAFKLSDDTLSQLKYSVVDEQPSDYEIYEVIEEE